MKELKLKSKSKEITLEEMRKDYKENKEEYDEMFKQAVDKKIESVTRNGHIDYLEISRLWHAGKW